MSSIYMPKTTEVGLNSFSKIGELITQFKSEKPLVIMDSFLAAPPISLDNVFESVCNKYSIESAFFTNYQGEPTMHHLEEAVSKANTVKADCIIAIGGGSAIDLGKGVAALTPNPTLHLKDLYGITSLQRLPLIAVPTTSGTGSEATKIAVITDTESTRKLNPGASYLVPDAAILDGKLTKSLPAHFTAYTGMDALTHAIEAMLSTRANSITDNFALSAIQLITNSIEKVYNEGTNLELREKMAIASYYAGIAFSNSSTNLAHAAGRVLGARFHIPHGLSVAVLLPFVMRYNLGVADERLEKISLMFEYNEEEIQSRPAEQAIHKIEEFNQELNIWKDFVEAVDLEQLLQEKSQLAEDALSGNGIQTNRKVPTRAEIENIFVELAEKLSNAGMVK